MINGIKNIHSISSESNQSNSLDKSTTDEIVACLIDNFVEIEPANLNGLTKEDIWKILSELATSCAQCTDLNLFLKHFLQKLNILISYDTAFIVTKESFQHFEIISEDDSLNFEFEDLSHTVKALLKRTINSAKPFQYEDNLKDIDNHDQFSNLSGNTTHRFFIPIIINSSCHVLYIEKLNLQSEHSKSIYSFIIQFCKWVEDLTKNNPQSHEMVQLNIIESTLNAVPSGIVLLNENGEILLMNNAALEIFDINANDNKFENKDNLPTLMNLFPESEQASWRYMIGIAFTSYNTFSEPLFYHDTGYMEKVLSVKISPKVRLPKRQTGILVYVEDITEKTINEKYIILSEKLVAQGEITNTIAHKMNNMLTVLTNNQELLKRHLDQKEYDKAKFNNSTIRDSINKINDYIISLTDLAKPEISFVTYDFNQIIEETILNLKTSNKFKHINLIININQDLPLVELDVIQIQQLLTQLMENAADAVQEKAISENAANRIFEPEIKLKADYDSQNELIIITIFDNGIGLSDTELKKIFNLHYTTKKKGHGLGLFNCKKIIDSHNGKIMVESEKGNGTKFNIILPQHQPRHIEE
ncbi:MAG: ATP-binding protein [candidate division Zixibacteria bacterium]|nr:ATP-binding protein [candidate division Zixibacteria bacterium]